jgi:hypothetical protein
VLQFDEANHAPEQSRKVIVLEEEELNVTRGKLATIAAIAILAAAPVRPDAATLEFTPYIGHLAPQNSQVAESDATIAIRQDAATAYGARVTWWIAPRIAAEASVTTASSGIQLIGNAVIGVDAQMFYADARARFRLNDPSATAGFDLIGGIGISDLGDGITDFGEDLGIESPSTVTWIVGLGATVAVSERIHLRFDAEDHIHDGNIEIDEANFGTPVEKRNQNDLLFTAGIVIPVWE